MSGSETVKGGLDMKKTIFGIVALLCLAAAVQSASAVVLYPEGRRDMSGYRYDVTQYTEPEVGPAATRWETKLYSDPRSDSDIEMTYFPNVRVEVLETGGEFVRVRIGEEDSGCMEGYVSAGDLAYGEEGIRAVQGRMVEYSSPNAVVLYAERDTHSRIIQNGIDLQAASALGYSRDWLHVRWKDSRGIVTVSGFVEYSKQECELTRNDPINYCATEPMDSELSYEEALEEAKRILVENHIQVNGREENITFEKLERCIAGIDCYWYSDNQHPLQYQVSFESDREMQNEGYPEYYIFIILEVEGKEVVGYNFGNG